MEDCKRGVRRLHDLDPAGAAHFVESPESASPELARLVVEVAFGRVHVGDQLNPKARELLTVPSLAVLGGCEAQLRFHVGGAVNVGVELAEVLESLSTSRCMQDFLVRSMP